MSFGGWTVDLKFQFKAGRRNPTYDWLYRINLHAGVLFTSRCHCRIVGFQCNDRVRYCELRYSRNNRTKKRFPIDSVLFPIEMFFSSVFQQTELLFDYNSSDIGFETKTLFSITFLLFVPKSGVKFLMQKFSFTYCFP